MFIDDLRKKDLLRFTDGGSDALSFFKELIPDSGEWKQVWKKDGDEAEYQDVEEEEEDGEDEDEDGGESDAEDLDFYQSPPALNVARLTYDMEGDQKTYTLLREEIREMEDGKNTLMAAKNRAQTPEVEEAERTVGGLGGGGGREGGGGYGGGVTGHHWSPAIAMTVTASGFTAAPGRARDGGGRGGGGRGEGAGRGGGQFDPPSNNFHGGGTRFDDNNGYPHNHPRGCRGTGTALTPYPAPARPFKIPKTSAIAGANARGAAPAPEARDSLREGVVTSTSVLRYPSHGRAFSGSGFKHLQGGCDIKKVSGEAEETAYGQSGAATGTNKMVCNHDSDNVRYHGGGGGRGGDLTGADGGGGGGGVGDGGGGKRRCEGLRPPSPKQ
jgi:hypothetical protein